MKSHNIKNVLLRFLPAGILLLLFCNFVPAQENRAPFKVISANIRVALPADTDKGHGWNDRKALLFDILKNHKPDIICLQEVLEVQNNDFKTAFPDFTVIGFEGPEMDVHTDGEYHGIAKNPIAFSNTRFKLVAAGQYWLSETPLKGGSISWNSARARNANWVRLKDRATSREFRVVNLHLDHKSQPARERQIRVVTDEAGQYPPDFPQVLAGDFNAGAKNEVYDVIGNAGWKDTYTAIHGDAEPGYTVHLFKGDKYEKKDKGRKIDFIFMRGADWQVKDASIIRDHADGRYPSDHYFVSADVLPD